MHIVVIITSNEVEKVWNAFRFSNTSLSFENRVDVFLLGQGVEAATISTTQYDMQEQIDIFLENGGNLIGCSVCCESRKEKIPFLLEVLKCELGSMQTLYSLVAVADKVLTF